MRDWREPDAATRIGRDVAEAPVVLQVNFGREKCRAVAVLKNGPGEEQASLHGDVRREGLGHADGCTERRARTGQVEIHRPGERGDRRGSCKFLREGRTGRQAGEDSDDHYR
jgi:hypothetical protein